MEILDIAHCPLQGSNLIEASAGTGKTYTIAALFLRLLVEENLAVDEILIVTFTRAATQELRQRLYATLHQALACFSGQEEGAEYLQQVRDKTTITLPEKTKRVQRAIRDFDEAAISTIHSFCQRMLVEYAFASAAQPDLEITADQAGLIMAAVQDFWRQYIAPAPLIVMEELTKLGLDGFFQLFHLQERNPELRIQGPGLPPDAKTLQQDAEKWQQAIVKVQGLLPDTREELIALLELERKLLKNYQRRYISSAAQKIMAWQEEADKTLTAKQQKAFTWYSAENIMAKAKGTEYPQHPIFIAIAHLLACHEQFHRAKQLFLAALQQQMFSFVAERLQASKVDLRIFAFNDFLVAMAAQLRLSADGGRLGQVVRQRFRAALIDEFQDTDTLQYTIFSHLFGQGRAILFLIGDPKQAIYSFRGADIYAYLQAARQIQQRYTLPTNYRSDAPLVAAVNTIFSPPLTSNPFGEEEINFQKVTAAITDSPLTIANEEGPGLHIWTPSPDLTTGSAFNLQDLLPLVTQAVTAEIIRLLKLAAQGQATLTNAQGKQRPLRPGDFAVLVRNKQQIVAMAQALAEAQVPAVQSSSLSIFATPEATIMEAILANLANPDSLRCLKTVLAQPIFTMTATEMQIQNEAGWPQWRGVMRDYGILCQQHGFLTFFRQFMADHDIKSHLLSQPFGERSLTNLIHLAEIIHGQQQLHQAAPDILQNWLATQIQDNILRDEEMEQRMESDENAVQIVTIHKSKGLEYPIVFAPFVWSSVKVRDNICHVDGEITLFLDREEFTLYKEQAHRELLAENLRLFYVALTRARHRCYTMWTKIGNQAQPAASAPAYLFHQGDASLASAEFYKTLKGHYDELVDVQAVTGHLHQLFANQPHISITPLPRKLGHYPAHNSYASSLHLPPLPPRPATSWQLTSFSSLSRHGHPQPGGDEGPILPSQLPNADTLPPAQNSIHDFPKGPGPGTFLHELLEQLDFTQINSQTSTTLITTALEQNHFSAKFQPVLQEMFNRLVKQPLADFCLAQVTPNQRYNELEFYFPLQRVTPTDLRELFHNQPGIQEEEIFSNHSRRLDFSPSQGYLHGFIDLIFCHQDKFYLVDWKSNYLGPDSDSYHQEALLQAMAQSSYYLQYHLYTLALHLHLQNTLVDYNYDRHFGGVYYLFLRGIAPERPGQLGVFQARPSQDMVNKMRNILTREQNHV